MRAFPRLFPEQTIFYPGLTKEYATKIALDRNGFFDVYNVQEAGGRIYFEYWMTAQDIDAFNDAIVGGIEVVREFHGP